MYTPSECYPKKTSFLFINNLFWIYYKGTPEGTPQGDRPTKPQPEPLPESRG
jgi:hypothetical protein